MVEEARGGERLPQKIIRNILWNFAGNGLLLAVMFFSAPFIIRALDVNLFGVYTLIGVVIGYFSFLQLGLGTASIKYISQYLAEKDERRVSSTFWSCLAMYLSVGVCGTVVIALSSRILVERFFRVPPGLEATAIIALRIGSLGFLAALVLGMMGGVIQAMGRFDIFNKVGVSLAALQIALAVILLKTGFSLREIVVSNIVIQAVGILAYTQVIFKSLPFLRGPSLDIGALARLFKFGGFVTISSVLNPILTNIDKLFITALRSVASLTYYAVPYSLIGKLSVMPFALSSVIFPAFSSLQHSSDERFRRELHSRAILYLAFMSAFFAVFFLIFGRAFLSAWLGEDFADRSSAILAVLAIAGFINAVAWPSFVALQGLERPHIPALFHLIETAVYIPSAYLLIVKFGGVGAAYAWLLRVLLDTLLLHAAASRLFGERLIFLYGDIVRRALAPLALSGALFLALRNAGLPFFGLLNIGGLFLISAFYAATVWSWGLDGTARGHVLEFIKSLRR